MTVQETLSIFKLFGGAGKIGIHVIYANTHRFLRRDQLYIIITIKIRVEWYQSKSFNRLFLNLFLKTQNRTFRILESSHQVRIITWIKYNLANLKIKFKLHLYRDHQKLQSRDYKAFLWLLILSEKQTFSRTKIAFCQIICAHPVGILTSQRRLVLWNCVRAVYIANDFGSVMHKCLFHTQIYMKYILLGNGFLLLSDLREVCDISKS